MKPIQPALPIITLVLCGGSAFARGDEHPVRRGVVGIAVRQPASGGGAEVMRLDIGSPAYQADLRAGDLITHSNGRSVDSSRRLAEALDQARADSQWRLRVSRAGRSHTITLVAQPAPQEPSTAEVHTDYTWLRTADGIHLRQLLTRPAGSGTRWPMVLILPGLGGIACDDPSFPMYRQVAHAFARHGFAVVRWDQRGSGDSYGAPYADVDFERETQDAGEILKSLLTRPDVDRSRIYAFGYSMGGVVGPNLIARQDGLAALVTWGTLSRPVVEYMINMAREQGPLAGLGAPEINRQVRLTIRFYERLLAGGEPHRLVQEYPQLREFAPDGTHVQGKTAQFWRQLDSTRYDQIYGSSRVPTLALYAEHDFIATLLDQTNIVDLARASGRADVHSSVIPGLDHYMNRVTSRSESFEKVKTRQYEFNPLGVDAAVQWIEKLEEFRRQPQQP